MFRSMLALFTMFFVLASIPAFADPCADVEVAFDPTSGEAHDFVTLSASLANTGDMDGKVTVAITVAFNDHSFGPLTGEIWMGAGEEISGSIRLPIVPALPAGTLTLTVEASAGECQDISVATLKILGEGDGDAEAAGFTATAAAGFLQALGLAPTPVQPTTWGALKQRYP